MDDLISRFKQLLDEHGVRSPIVQDFVNEHPEIQRLIDSASHREELQIIPSE